MADLPKSLLIVEDSPVQAKIIRKQFEVFATSINILIAHILAEAEATLAEEGEIILATVTDLNLPDAPNGEAVDMCLKHKTPCVVLTATGSGPLTAQFLKNGANDFLTNPFEAEEFCWRVNQPLSALDVRGELRDCRKLVHRLEYLLDDYDAGEADASPDPTGRGLRPLHPQ